MANAEVMQKKTTIVEKQKRNGIFIKGRAEEYRKNTKKEKEQKVIRKGQEGRMKEIPAFAVKSQKNLIDNIE